MYKRTDVTNDLGKTQVKDNIVSVTHLLFSSNKTSGKKNLRDY